MSDSIRSVTVKVRGDVSSLERAYTRGGKATDDFADKLERAESNSQLLSDRQDELGARLRRNAGTVKSLNRDLDKMGSSSSGTATKVRRLSEETQVLERRNRSLGPVATKTSSQIDRFSGRLALAAQAAIALGPGAIAGVTPLLAGLTAQAVAGGTGLAVLIGSFQGVKTAVTAMNKSALDPSIANLQAEQAALQDISPAAREMARDIQSRAIPALKELRDQGASTAFPGIIKGAEQLGSRLPQTKQLIGEVGLELGDLATRAGTALAGDDWDRVFNYALATTPGLLDDVSSSLGNVTLALFNTLAASDPLTQQWSKGFRGFTDDLVDGSSKLEDSNGFQDFLGYAQQVGPEVVTTLGQVGSALIDIGKAGAPVSGPLIKTLGQVAELVGNIADSDFGTPLVAGALGLTALNKALVVTDRVAGSQAGALIFGGRGAGGAGGSAGGAAGIGRVRTSIRGLTSDIKTANSLPKVRERFGIPSAAELDAQAAAAGRLRTRAVGLGKSAALVGAVGVATTGAADGLGVTNTATLALAGSLAGAPGAAIGAGAGFLLDLRDSAKDSAGAVTDLNRQLSAGNITKSGDALTKVLGNYADLRTYDSFGDFTSDNRKILGNFLQGNNPFNDASEIRKQIGQLDQLKASVAGLAQFTANKTGIPELVLGPKSSLGDYQKFLDGAAPALDHLGVSVADLNRHSNDGEYLARVSQGIIDYNEATDSVAARTAAVGSSIGDLSNPLLSTAQSASQLATSLNSLLTPGLNAEAAADNLAASYEKMRDTLKQGRDAGFSPATEKGRDNRAATRDVVTGVEDRLTTAAANGAGAAKLGAILQRSRAQFLQEGKAAGFSAEQIAKRANQLGLTPKLVRTVLKAVGADESSATVNNFAKKIQGLPKSVQTDILANGVPRSVGAIDRLQRKYNLTPAQVRTLATLKDQSSVVIAKVLRRLGILNGSSANPSVNARDNASGIIARASSLLASFNGRSATATITTIQRTIYQQQGKKNQSILTGAVGMMTQANVQTYAAGGLDARNAHQPELAGPGPTRVWREPETGGESYIPHANDSRRARAKAITEQTANLFGGQVSWNANGGMVTSVDPRRGSRPAATTGQASTPTSFRIASGRLALEGGGFATIEDAHLIASDYVEQAFSDDDSMRFADRLAGVPGA